MISALLPGFLAAGAALALVPLALHFLARRPPELEPLPTARFLQEEARMLLRLQKQPTHILLLLLRVAFALALGAIFAKVMWVPERSGTGRIVLLNAGADEGLNWTATLELTRVTAEGGTPEQPATVVVYGLDGGARTVSIIGLSELIQGQETTTAEDGLRALRQHALSDTRFTTVEAVWVTRPTWRLWNTGVGLLRPALWPGSVPFVEASAMSPGGDEPDKEPITALILGGEGTRNEDTNSLIQVFRALGIVLVPEDEAKDKADSPDWVFAESPTTTGLEALTGLAEAGSTVVVSGALPGESGEPNGLPWVSSRRGPDEVTNSVALGGIVLDEHTIIGTSVLSQPGAPAPGSRTFAVFETTRPAAASVSFGEGCLVYLSASLHDPTLTSDPDYPSLVDALGRGCAPNRSSAPLGEGARSALQRPDLADLVDVTALSLAEGTPLTLWFTLLALLLFALEIGLTRKSRP